MQFKRQHCWCEDVPIDACGSWFSLSLTWQQSTVGRSSLPCAFKDNVQCPVSWCNLCNFAHIQPANYNKYIMWHPRKDFLHDLRLCRKRILFGLRKVVWINLGHRFLLVRLIDRQYAEFILVEFAPLGCSKSISRPFLLKRGSFNVRLSYARCAVQACVEVLHKTNDALCGLD